jgi:hypothetical protein
MRFMRLPILMVVIALAASVSTQFSFLLRFSALALATLTLLGALSDMQRAARNASGMQRDDLLKLWFGSKLREQHTWEALKEQVSATASALRLPAPPAPALPTPDPLANGARTSSLVRLPGSPKKQVRSKSETPAPAEQARSTLGPRLRLLAIEALSEALVIGAIALNWFLPAPKTSSGEQLALLVLGLLALGLLWFDWRVTRRFVAAVQAQLARLQPHTSTSTTSSS